MEQPTASDRLEVLLAHRAWVQRVARALVLDESRADDLEQETWFRALRTPPPEPTRAWLGTVLRNAASTMRVAERRREAHESSAPPPRARPSPEALLERAEVVERVARAVRTLEEPCRTAILLRYFEDLSPPAIAAQLAVPLETVRTRLRRGLVRLREQLDREHRGDRRKWALLLLPLARRPEPAAAGSALAAGAAGVVLMTLKTKSVVAAVLVLLAAGAGLWNLSPGPGAAPPDPRSSALPPVADARSHGAAPIPSREVKTEEPATVPAQAPAAAPGAAVVGRVLDGETGLPVRGATVSLVFQFGRQDPAQGPAALTDEDGRFRIEGIEKDRLGTDSLLVLADRYAEAFQSVHGWGEKIRGGDPVDLGEVRLERGAAVAGRVLTADGRPIPGAAVLFCRETPITAPATFGPNFAREVAVTDAGGRFSLERVPSARTGFHHTLYAVAETAFGWLALPPVAGMRDLGDQDIRMAPTAVIEVTVREPGGRPVEGARVITEPHFPPLGTQPHWPAAHDLWIEAPSLRALFEGTTDSSGRLRLGRVPVDGDSCRYDVLAHANGFSRGWTDGVEVSPDGSTHVSVTLNPIRSSTFSGTVRDSGGRPVAEAEVNFIGQKGRTDATGTFRIEGIDPTSMNNDPWVVVAAEGFATEGRRIDRSLPWDQGGNEFVLEPGVPVKGQVVDEGGRSLEGVGVTLKRGDLGIDTGRSGPDGRFSLKSAAGENSTLSFHPPEPVMEWLVPDDARIPGDGSEIHVVLRRMPPGARLVVEVLDAESGRPVDPTNAALHAVDWRSMPRTYGPAHRLESGRVVVDRALPGDWVLWVAAEGRAPARVEIHVEKGREEIRTRVLCGAPGSVRGRLEGLPEGGSRPRVVYLSLVGMTSKPPWVRLQSDPKLIDAASVEEDGTFRIDGVPPGRLRIWTEFEGFKGETVVEVLSGTEVTAVVTLVTQGRATFRPAGVPPRPAVLVRFASGGGEWGRWSYFAKRDDTIPEWTANVPPGRVRWQARFVERGDGPFAEEPAAAEGEFEAMAGETVVVPIPVR